MESRSLLCRRIAGSILDSVLYVLIAACLNQLINDAINARFPNPAVALFVQTVRSRVSIGFWYEALTLLFVFWAFETMCGSSRLRATPGKLAIGLAVDYRSSGIWAVVRAQVRIVLKLLYACTPLYIAIASGWFGAVMDYSSVTLFPGSNIPVGLGLVIGLLMLTPALGLAHPRGELLYDTLSGTTVVARSDASKDTDVMTGALTAVAPAIVIAPTGVVSRMTRWIGVLALASSATLVIAGSVGLYGSARIYTDFAQIVAVRLAEADAIRDGRPERDLSPDEQNRLREISARMTDGGEPVYASTLAFTLSSLALAAGLLATIFSATTLLGRWPVAFQVVWPTAAYFAYGYRATAAWHAQLAEARYGQLQLSYVPTMLDLATSGLVAAGLLSLALMIGIWASQKIRSSRA